jgi:phosphoribosylformylglycinamidine synthase PurS subunit
MPDTGCPDKTSMKAIVQVALKKTVLDPQGQTIRRSLASLGYSGIRDVRQGKFFEIDIENGANREEARREIEKMAREVLTNPVIEEFTYRLED